MVGISIGTMPELAPLEDNLPLPFALVPELAPLEDELALPFDLALQFAFAPAFRSMLPPDGFVVAAA